MRKILVVIVVTVILAIMPVLAQEEAANMPPKPLSDPFTEWTVGEWEGTSTSPMGTSHDQVKVEWGLDKQFTVMHYTSQSTEVNQDALKAMNMSPEQIEAMKDMEYKGMGLSTLDPKTGKTVSYWFDNWRGMYHGEGTLEGNVLTTKWEGPMGTSTRTMEKVSEDKMVMTMKETGPDGKSIEGKTELTRVK